MCTVPTARRTNVAGSWWWGGALAAAAIGLIVFGTRLPERPVPMTNGSDSLRPGVDGYVGVRQRIEGTIPALRVTDEAAEILGREAAIGTAVQAGRPRAAQGEVFTAAVADNVRAIVAADMGRRSMADRASIMADVPATPPRVNDPYPESAALATFPPLLLQALPRLPDDLEYRFMGRHLIIRDGRTNLIVDYLSDVAPAAEVMP